MLKIGDFAKLSRVSIKALRYYDEVGLLKPVEVDPGTGYRYYSLDQLPRLNRILALKDLGFSLEQIARLADGDLPAAQIRGVLRMKQFELQQRIRDEQDRLARVEARLQELELNGSWTRAEVLLKSLEPQRVIARRGPLRSPHDVRGLYAELDAHLLAHAIRPAGPPVTLWHLSESEPVLEAEATVPVPGPVPESERVRLVELPGSPLTACSLQRGAYDSLDQATWTVYEWIAMNGYHIAGPAREVHLQFGAAGQAGEYLAEFQVPIAKG